MKVLIVAGGTGGHLYPGLAVARALAGHEILFAIRRGDLCCEILEKEEFKFAEIAGQGMPRALSMKAILFPLRFLQSWKDSRALLQRFRPDCVLGMGGYLSAPVIFTAHAMGIKTMIHEQNVFPGLANRWLDRWADSVAVSFSESQSYFKNKNIWVSGLPVRPEIGQVDQKTGRKRLGLEPDKLTIFVFGGSLGAQKLNTVAVSAWTELQKKLPFQVLHVTGSKDFERVQSLYKGLDIPAKVLPYCHQMADAYAAADGVICRAGATTVAELLAVGRPALLVPYPYASNNHQLFNAKVLTSSGKGALVLDQNLKSGDILAFVLELTSQSSRPASPSQNNTAEEIAGYLVKNS